MKQSEKDPNVWSTLPHGMGDIQLRAKDIQPLRGFTKVFASIDEAGFFSPPKTEQAPDEVTLTFSAVPDATGYVIYTGSQLLQMAQTRRKELQLRKALNRRKKVARARTGRR